ncbi:MAG: hypothetical protein KDE53_13465, partial [Caldilineaceae bacterium]|nr:hypothetical protein [Caldilineaceae bacterium]
TPVTWPVSPWIDVERGQLMITTSIALPEKAYNVRRNGRVALSFSEPKASRLTNPPIVVVQGDAVASKQIYTWSDELAELWPILYWRQPASVMYGSNWLARKLFDWYYMRLLIHVTPRSILWWENGDFTQAPQMLYAPSVVEIEGSEPEKSVGLTTVQRNDAMVREAVYVG